MKHSKFAAFLLPALIFAGCTSMDGSTVTYANDEAASGVMAPCAPAAAPIPIKRKAMTANGVSADRHFAAPEGRKMAFTANLTISVSDLKKAIADTRKQTAASGGYVKSLNNNYLVLAIPITKGDDFLNILSGMGEVTDLSINGSDVTEQVADLKIRMENLEKSRKRLLALMDRTANVKDLTQVERELNRVTTELERLQAADKNLTNRIAYVTITIRFNTFVPVKPTPTPKVPLTWINDLGADLQRWVANDGCRIAKTPFRVELPAKFFFADNEYAVSGNNCNLRFREIPNAVTNIRWFGKEYAGIDLYKNMIETALKVRFDGKVSFNECTIDGEKAFWYQAETKIYGTEYLYLVAISVDGDTVRVIEAKGRKASLLEDLTMDGWKKMLESIR